MERDAPVFLYVWQIKDFKSFVFAPEKLKRRSVSHGKFFGFFAAA
jgi:hypothetical protein